MTRELGGGEVIWFRYTIHFLTFSQTKIWWNKQNTLHPEIRIWQLEVLTMQSSLTWLLCFSKYLKWLNLPPSRRHFTQIKPDINGVEVKSGRVHPINFCGWSSKIFYACPFLQRKRFLNLSEKLPLNRSFQSSLS